ncbi:putative esterase [Clostridium bornimense]|uniref:Putative esterase n=1 Tax=Clostridium bornimense TaxID=1216932 RepID=W6RW68_9CLOT|nr:alpha/beta hydrolase-fold protein [Clostridium bornimense]CDM68901.1 putative esterase [Clostridium bornimense]
MNKKIKLILPIISLALIATVAYFIINGNNSTPKNDTIKSQVTSTNKNIKNNNKGTIKVIKNFNSPELSNKKTLRIYLPYNYENSNKSYPVIYMQDGENLFDTKTATYNKEWKIDETLDNLIDKGKTEGIIIVGIDSRDTTRVSEYNIFSSSNNYGQTKSAKGDKYAEFIVKTLKPYIDENYRTLKDKDNTAIIGSSYGAIISMYTGIEYNDIFGMIGAFSFCDNINSSGMKNYLTKNLTKEKMDNTKIYFYSGTADFAYKSTKDAFTIATNNDLKDILYEEDNGNHDELSWGPKFKNCLSFFKLLK